MEHDALDSQISSLIRKYNLFSDSTSLRRQAEDGGRSLSNEYYVGRTINVPRNSIMAFKDCKFVDCTFIFRQ
jgi:hypothetical protein